MATVVELLCSAVQREPDRTAISFAHPAGSLTNAEWYRQVCRIATHLRRDTRVMLLLPAGPDFFAVLLAAFHAGACAVPTPPPAATADRFVAVAIDADAEAIVTTAAIAATSRRIWDVSGAPPIRWIVIDEPHPEGNADPVAVAPVSLAVLQYTSGSTGKPKGVAISHQVLTAWLDGFVDRVALAPGSTVVTWAPVHHALGLTVALMALPMDGRTTVLTPEYVLADPVRWLRAISDVPTPVFSGAPPFAYQLCVDGVTPDARQGLDLSRWEVALIGSERIRPQTLDRFVEAFGPHGFAMSAFFPSYGMTEIMMAAGHRGPAEPVRLTVDAAALERRQVRPGACDRTVELVASGPPCLDVDLVIVDPDTHTPCPDGRVGELWVRGPIVSDGYWRRPEQTAETFGQRLADGTGPYLRTGDLAFFHQGELVVCGRLSELIIVRGRNLLPQDVEATVQAAHSTLAGKPAAAFVSDGDDADDLVIVATADPEVAEPDRVAEHVRRAVTAGHDVEAHAVLLVPPGQIPQTGTGKVQRAACRRAFQEDAFTPFGAARAGMAEPSTPVVTASDLHGLLAALPERLRQTVAEAEIRRRIGALTSLPVDTVAADSPLIELGLDSLRMIKLRGLLADAGLDKPLTDLAKSTVAELAAALAAVRPDQCAPVLAGCAASDEDRFEPFPLTDVQHAYLMGSSWDYPLSGVSTHYYTEFDSRGLDVRRLHDALRRLMRRHDMLCAVASLDGTQRVLPDVPDVPMPVSDLRTAGVEQVAAHLERVRAELSHQTFPAGTWPLFDVRVSLLPDEVCRVHVSLDLLVVDLWSLRVLSRDWRTLYERPDTELSPLGTTFRKYLADAARDSAAAREYWLGRLDSLPPGPDLPLRRLPQAGETPRFHRRAAQLARPDWDTLRERAGARGLTAVSVLLAAYATVLGAWSRRSRFTLSLPTFNRKPLHPQVEELVGDFTSVTLLEVDLDGATTLTDLATRLRDQLWQDLEHQDFDGVRVLRELARHRGVSAELFAPTVFAAAVGQTDDSAPELPLTWLGEQVYALSQTPQVLLDHQILEGADGIAYNWDSVDDAFADGVLDEMFAAYRALLDHLAAGDETGWAEPLVTALAAHQALPASRANRTDGPCPGGLLHEPLLDQVRLRPDNPAVIGPDRTLTFAELRDHAAALAHQLRALGACPNQLVAVAMPKSVEQVVAALAVHLAAAAYLPVDPDLPVARQDRLLAQGQCRIVLCLAGGIPRGWPDGVKAVGVDLAMPPQAPVEPPEPVATATDLAYVIFTSGSTGEPKGVAVAHRAALNTCVDVNERFGVGPEDRLLGLSSLSFDLSVYDVFGVLGAGGTLVVPPAGSGRDPGQWLELIECHRVTIWNSVPPLMVMLTEYTAESLPDDPLALRLALLSGDWVPLALPDHIRRLAPDCRVVSLGGATEAAIWSICYEVDAVDPGWESVPYGTPMRNQRFHVLNDLWQECPAHVTGELFIAGAGLADGYFGDPKRTAERFVVNPHTGERLYRTGDLGRWRTDGTIEFLGREDFQVKVGGYRIELGEIENTIVAVPGVKAAVVTAPGNRSHRRLVAYFVPDEPAGTDDDRRALTAAVTEHITHRLPAYMVPPTMVVIDAIPLSGNGKVDRSALPDPVAAPAADPADGAADPMAEDLRGRIARLMRTEPDQLSAAAPLPSLGIDSLRAIELRNELKRDHGIVLPMRTLLSGSLTIGELACTVRAALDGDTADDARELPRVQARPELRYEAFDLTDLQHAYLVGRSGDYALGGVGSHFYVEFDSADLRADRLHVALTRLVERHDMLRAVISADGTQRVLDELPPVPLPVYDLRDNAADDVRDHLDRVRAEMASQAFTLGTWPLFDVRVSRLPDGMSRLHFGMDLLIADVWSIGILLREWEALYRRDNAELPPLSLTFRDYLAAAKSIPDTWHAEAYWAGRIDTLPPGPDLPLRADADTLGRPPNFERRSTRLSAEDWTAVKAQAAQRDLTPNAVLLACYAAVLGRWSRRQRFTLNLPTFNRHPLHVQVNGIIGDFTSVTLLEVDLGAPGGLAGLARRVHERLVSDLEHREYSGVQVMRELARRGGVPEPFAPVVFTSALGQDRHGGGDLALGWLGEQVFGISQTPQVLLDNQVYELAGELVVHWDAVAELFPADVLGEMFTVYCEQLRRLALGWWDLPQPPRAPVADGPVPAGLLHDRVLDQARTRPDATAVVAADGLLTFGDLRAQAAAVAARLRELGVPSCEPVAVSLPRGTRQVVAALGVLLAGCPYVPVEPEPDTEQRLAEIGCRTVLCENDADWSLRTLVVDSEVHVDMPEPRAIATDPAYLLFSSDSAVAVSHRAALNTCVAVGDRFDVGASDRVFGLSPLTSDLSVFDVFGVLGAGGTLVLPDDTGEWVDQMRRHRVTVWNSTPSQASALVEQWESAPVEIPLRLMLVSRDTIPSTLAERIRALAPSARVVGLGGAPETALWSACQDLAPGESTWYGTPLRNQRVHVLNDRGWECPAHSVGELHLAGVGLADGYVGDPERTAERFVIDPHTGERFYRTGDLGRRRPDGAVELLGRADATGGPAVDPSEISAALLGHPHVRAATIVETERGLIGYVVPADSARTLDSLRTRLRERLPSHRLPALVLVDELPLTDDGEVDHTRLPDPAPADDHGQTDAAQRLCVQIADLLRVEPADVPVTVPLPALGMDSLRAIQLRNRVQRELGVALSMRTLLSSSVTIVDLAVALAADLGDDDAAPPLPAVRPEPHLRTQPFGLTDLQQAYLIGRSPGLDLGGVSTYFYAECVGEHDADRLVAAFQAVVDRHDMLRATVTPEGEQRVLADPPPVPVRRYDLRGSDTAAVDAHLERLRNEMAQQVIPLGTWPLFDLRLTCLDDGRVHVHLGCDMLIADVWSIGLLLREWEAFYRSDDPGVRPLTLTFRDYLTAARKTQEGPRALRARRYWQGRLDSLPAAPRLPTLPRPSTRSAFDRRDLRFDPPRWEALKRHAASSGVTPNAVLLAALAAVIGQWSRTSRFLLNLPTFNRAPLHDEVDAIIGDFTSVTLLDADLADTQTVGELAARIHTRLLEALDHREYSGIQVLRDLSRRRAADQPALAPVVFTSALGQGADDRGDLPTSWLGTQVHGRSQTPQVLLDNQVYEVEGGLVVHWDVIVEMFPPGVVDAMFDSYQSLLDRITHAGLTTTLPGTPTGDRELVAAANATDGPVPPGLLHDRIVALAAHEPDRTAVIAPARELSFGDLHRHARAVAAMLRAAGVEPGQLVGVALPSSAERVVAVLGVLLAGAAFLPIDPDLPADHRAELLPSRVVLGADGTDWPADVRVVGVDLTADPGGVELPDSTALPTSGAYVDCRVAVSHQAALTTFIDVCERFGINDGDRVLGLSSLAFEAFGVLGAGGVLVLPGAGNDPARWLAAVSGHSVSVWSSTPSLAGVFADHVAGQDAEVPLRVALLDGDWVPDRWRSAAPTSRVVSLAGTGVWSIADGRPLRNRHCHVLNDRWQECPVHVVGEVFVSGASGEPERFVTHPESGERMFRTGKLGRRRPDGTVEFLGSERGELGEIEHALWLHPWVRDAAVTGAGGDVVAHIVPALLNAQLQPTASPAVGPDLFTPEERALVLFDDADRVDFKVARKGLRADLTGEPVLMLTADTTVDRASERRYAARPVPLAELAALLEPLRSQDTGALPKYRYASAGNSYAVQTYLHVVDGKVDGLPGGTYYHDPAGHRLVPVVPGATLTDAVRLGADRQALDTAAFTVFLVAALDAIEPLYGPRTARDVCLIEAGLMTQLLEDTGRGHGIGLCQLRVVAGTQAVREVLRLGERHEVIHTLLGGALLRAGEEPAAAPPPRTPEAVLDAVRAHIADRLPEHLQPSEYALVEALPQTGDRAMRAAPTPAPVPADGVEARIAEVIQTLLGLDTIGRDTGFFNLGADSVLLVRAHRRLQAALDRRFPLTHMFEHATVRKLAAALVVQSDDRADLLADAARRANRAKRVTRRPARTAAAVAAQEGQA